MTRILLCVLAAFLFACGGRQTTASKSAAALRDAQAKGGAVAHEHGTPNTEHGTHDHGAMQHDAAEHASAQHSAHGEHGTPNTEHGTHDRSAVQHDATEEASAQHSAHSTQHSGTEHSGMHHAPAREVTLEPTPTEPTAILRPDAFDAPAPASVAEAAKSRKEKP